MKIKISGVIGGWEVEPKEIVSQINNMTGDFEIELNSVGGSVIGGISIANAIRDYDKGQITVIVDSVSASIASYFMMFADKVIVHDNTTIMIHNAWLPVVGDFIALRKGAEISEGLSGILAKAYISKTSKPEDEIKDMMNEETYFYGQEILDNGFADEIISTDTETTKAEAQALTISSLEACNNAILQNEKLSFEAVAQFIPENKNDAQAKKDLEELEKKERLANLQAKQKRSRELNLLKLKRKQI